MNTLRRLISPTILGCIALAATPAGAQLAFPASVVRPPESGGGGAEESGLLFRAGLGAQGIDNIYGTASGHASDVLTTESLGASLKSSYSLQRILLDASISANQYQNHSDLSYSGNSITGAWQWSLGSNLFGSVNGSRTITQNALGTTVNSQLRNLNTSQSSSAVLGYEFGGGWQLTGGWLRAYSANDQEVYGQALVSQSSAAFTAATYVFASGNSMSLKTLAGTGANTYDFSVRSTEFQVNSITNVGTTISGQMTYWQQTYSTRSEYDFSGLMGRLTTVWQPSDKTSVQLALQRQLYGVPLANSIYTVTDSLTLAPSWEMLPKFTLRGNWQKSVIRYQGDPGAGNSGQVDNFQMLSMGLAWKPADNSELSINYSRSNHTSNLNNSEIVINVVSALWKISF